MTANTLTKSVLKLRAEDRAKVAATLLSSLENEDVKENSSIWAKEAEDRLQAFHAGEVNEVDTLKLLEYRGRPAR